MSRFIEITRDVAETAILLTKGGCNGQVYSPDNAEIEICRAGGAKDTLSRVEQATSNLTPWKSYRHTLDYRRNGKYERDCCVTYSVDRIDDDGRLVFRWDNRLYCFKPGWYEGTIRVCCEPCKTVLIRLGDCVTGIVIENQVFSPTCPDTNPCAPQCGPQRNIGCKPDCSPIGEKYTPDYNLDC